MIKKIVVLTVSILFLYVSVSFAWTTSAATINAINYDSTDVLVEFTDSSSWNTQKAISADTDTKLNRMIAILLTAIASGQQCKMDIVAGVVVGIEILE